LTFFDVCAFFSLHPQRKMLFKIIFANFYG
jgi:hypothetical protein